MSIRASVHMPVEMGLWLMVWRERVDSYEACRSDPEGHDFFSRDRFGDRDGSWRVCACEGKKAEMACMEGRDGLLSMGV